MRSSRTRLRRKAQQPGCKQTRFRPSKARIAASEASGSRNKIDAKLPRTSLLELCRRNGAPCLCIFEVDVRYHEVVQRLPRVLRDFDVLVLDVHPVSAEPCDLHGVST